MVKEKIMTTRYKLRNTLFDIPNENKFISPHVNLAEYVEYVSLTRLGKQNKGLKVQHEQIRQS